MGRSIFVDDSVQTSIGELIKSNKWFTGVIIGQLTQQRDYVIHIARTPDPVEDEACEENGDSDADAKTTKAKPSVVRPKSLDQLDDKWVSTHAKQVSRMLPGGLSVVGLFAIAPTNVLQTSQIKLKQMMYSVHKSLTKNTLLVPTSEITDRILLQVDSTTRKLTCTTLNVADAKSTPRPADWKYQSVTSGWTRLNAQLSVDIPISVPADSKIQSSLLKQLQGGLSAFCESVNQSVISIDGTIREGSELLVPQSDTRKSGKGGKNKGKGDVYDNVECKVEIFIPKASSVSNEENTSQVIPSVVLLRVCGVLSIRAYVCAKATVDDAIQAIRSDVVRSLYARCELLCEEDDVTEDKEGGSIHSPPVRYFFHSPNPSVDFCDYAFQDERPDEMTQRIQELMDINVENLDTVECHATDEDTWSFLSSSMDDEGNGFSGSESGDTTPNTVKTYIVAAVGGALAMLVSGISYLYLQD